VSGDQIYNVVRLGLILGFCLVLVLGLFYLGTRGERKTENDEREKSE
jgi:hypothetical protein